MMRRYSYLHNLRSDDSCASGKDLPSCPVGGYRGLGTKRNVQPRLASGMFPRFVVLFLCFSMTLVAQAQMTPQKKAHRDLPASQVGQTGSPYHAVPMVPRSAQKTSAFVGPSSVPGPAGAQLLYYGGPVISNGKVIAMNSFADPGTRKHTWALRLLPN